MGIFLGPRTDPYLFVSSAFVLHFLFQDLGKTSTQCRLDLPLPLRLVIIFRRKAPIGEELFNTFPQGRSEPTQAPTSGAGRGHGALQSTPGSCCADTAPCLCNPPDCSIAAPRIKPTRIKSPVAAVSVAGIWHHEKGQFPRMKSKAS